jgi:hypothetical protein
LYQDTFDIKKGIAYFEQAAETGNAEALMCLSSIYMHGQGLVTADVNYGLQCLERAAALHCSAALIKLGTLYYTGIDSIERDLDKASRYWERAIELDGAEALLKIGEWFEKDQNNLKEALRWYIRLPKDIDFTSHDKRHTAALQCISKLGYGFLLEGEYAVAQETFQQCIDHKGYFGYLGLALLAELQDNHEEMLQNLIYAAEHGVPMAWQHLLKFANDSVLHSLWTVDNLAVLNTLYTMGNHHAAPRVKENKPMFTYFSQCEDCSICELLQCKSAAAGSLESMALLSFPHIDDKVFNDSLKNAVTAGTGGQGKVLCLEVNTSHGKSVTVALKKPNSDTNLAYLVEEWKLLQLFQGCPSIVQCYGHTKLDDDIYVVMELACYGDLLNLLDADFIENYLNSIQGPGLILQWMLEIANGLAEMHRYYIRHGDIKPLNILVFEGLHVKLADLGYSKRTQYASQETSSERISYSADGTVNSVDLLRASASNMGGGTQGYIAPEQPRTVASDLYSFGVLCLHIVPLRLPSFTAVARAFQDAANWWKERCPEGEAVMELIERCLSHSPEERPTAQECVETLKKIMETVPCNVEEDSELAKKLMKY